MVRTCRFISWVGAAVGLASGCESIPSTPSVVIEPVVATTADDLEVVLVTESIDRGGDEVSYQVSWFQDGTQRSDLSEWSVSAAETRRGERWEVQVVGSDGSLESGIAEAWVEVSNSVPLISSMSLLPEVPRTSDDLEVEYEVEDVDGDPVEVSFAWMVDGGETWHAEASIPAHATTRGENWSVVVSVSDGTNQGEEKSASTAIENTPPEAPSLVTVFPSEPTTEDPLVCQVEGEITDVDGEEVSYSVAWLVDGQAYLEAESGLHFGDTVPAIVTSVGQVWSCAATPSDGSDEGVSGASESVEIQDAG